MSQQFSDEALADQLAARCAENHVFSLYVVRFSPRDVVYGAAKFYHRGNTADVREARVAHTSSVSETLQDLLRNVDIANHRED